MKRQNGAKLKTLLTATLGGGGVQAHNFVIQSTICIWTNLLFERPFVDVLIQDAIYLQRQTFQ